MPHPLPRNNFVRGFTAAARAFRLLSTDTTLRRLALRPFLVNLLVFAVGGPLLSWGLYSLIDGFLGRAGVIGPTTGILAFLVTVVELAAAVVIAIPCCFILCGIIAAPFHSKLSAAVESKLAGGVPAGTTSALQDAARGLAMALGRAAIFLLLYPVIMLTGFIPVVGFIVEPVLSILYAAFVLSIDFSDYVFERHLARFGEKVRYIRQRKALYLGFGLATLAMGLIPIVNLLVMPVCVAAATVLFVENEGAG